MEGPGQPLAQGRIAVPGRSCQSWLSSVEPRKSLRSRDGTVSLTNLFCCLIPSWKHPWHPTSTSQLAICGCCPLLHCLTGWGWVTPLGAVVLYPLGCLFTRLHEPKCHNCLQVMRFRPPTIFVTLCWTLSSFSASLCNLRVQTWASYRHCLSCVEERSGSNFLLCPGHTPNVLSTQN